MAGFRDALVTPRTSNYRSRFEDANTEDATSSVVLCDPSAGHRLIGSHRQRCSD